MSKAQIDQSIPQVRLQVTELASGGEEIEGGRDGDHLSSVVWDLINLQDGGASRQACPVGSDALISQPVPNLVGIGGPSLQSIGEHRAL